MLMSPKERTWSWINLLIVFPCVSFFMCLFIVKLPLILYEHHNHYHSKRMKKHIHITYMRHETKKSRNIAIRFV
jgi:hypothetical protein